MTRVVNHRMERGDISIMRRPQGMHFGNPFSHMPGTLATVAVASRHDAVVRYESWLAGETDQEVEPERRAWIMECLPALKDVVLECCCKPAECHGDVLVELIDGNERTGAA